MINERKLKIAMLIILCYGELLRRKQDPFKNISYLIEIAIQLAKIKKLIQSYKEQTKWKDTE